MLRSPVTTMDENVTRAALKTAKRVVLKVGSRVLVDNQGKPLDARIASLVSAIQELRDAGREVILVTSGAIGTGMGVLKISRRPKILSELQMCAAVGQSRLMNIYSALFAEGGTAVGQVLLTYDDLRDRNRHLNARNTFLALLRRRVLPIVNENDVVSVNEIKFGDNDVLAALVATLVDADALLLLSTTNGLRQFHPGGGSKRVSYLPSVTKEALELVSGTRSELSAGGMSSKLISAQRAYEGGALAVIANGLEPDTVKRVFAGEAIGTIIGAPHRRKGLGKKRWIKFFQKSKGTVVIDDGAARALLERGSSLLPVGVRKVSGIFGAGSPIEVTTASGTVVGIGLVEFASEELESIRGKKSTEVKAALGAGHPEEVIHRDNLVLLQRRIEAA